MKYFEEVKPVHQASSLSQPSLQSSEFSNIWCFRHKPLNLYCEIRLDLAFLNLGLQVCFFHLSEMASSKDFFWCRKVRSVFLQETKWLLYAHFNPPKQLKHLLIMYWPLRRFFNIYLQRFEKILNRIRSSPFICSIIQRKAIWKLSIHADQILVPSGLW
jgi:hypothetical protein